MKGLIWKPRMTQRATSSTRTFQWPKIMECWSPFIVFKSWVLKTINFSLSQLAPSERAFIRAFEIPCNKLEISYIGDLFFSYYVTKTASKCKWVTLSTLLGSVLFSLHSDNYKKRKDIFLRVRGKYDHSTIIFLREPRISVSILLDWNPVEINKFNYVFLSKSEKEAFDILAPFNIICCDVIF